MEKIIAKLVAKNYYEEGIGLTLDEIETLNKKIAKDIPPFFEAYLSVFGWNENVFWGVFNEEDDFIEQNELIQELGYTDFIAIGDEYSENLLLAKIENQQLFLLEDDYLIDLKMSFNDMLNQAVEDLEDPSFVVRQQVNTAYVLLQPYKKSVLQAFKSSFNQLKADTLAEEDALYGLVVSKDSISKVYKLSAGSFKDFKVEIEKERMDVEYLWDPTKMAYQQALSMDDILIDTKTELEGKALDLLLLDVLRELKEEGYFDDQMDCFSISIQSGDVYLFPEDSYDESLGKEHNLKTIIRRFWESPYDRTRVLIDNL